MTDHEAEEHGAVHPHVVTVETETEARAIPQPPAKEKSTKDFYVFKRSFVHWILGGFVVALLLGGLAFWQAFNANQGVALKAQNAVVGLSQEVSDLRDELTAAQALLKAGAESNQELGNCRKAFDIAISEATSNILLKQSLLVVAIANQDGSQAAAVSEIAQAGVALQQAQDQRRLFEANGAQLPCPIPAAG